MVRFSSSGGGTAPLMSGGGVSLKRPRKPGGGTAAPAAGGGGTAPATLHCIAVAFIAASGTLLVAAYAYLFSIPSGALSPPIPGKGAGAGIVGTTVGGGRDSARIALDSAHNVKLVAASGDDPVQTSGGNLRPVRAAAAAAAAAATRTVAEVPSSNSAAADAASDNNNNGNVRATVAYAVSLTGCGPDPLTDGGAVLKHSIHLSSSSNPESTSRYDYKMYAIVHPTATECATDLERIGYELLIRDDPVPVHEIRGDFLRTKVVDNGCCGEKEFIKLHAYALVGHPIVVHLDLDTIVLRPMDVLFDVMMDGGGPGSGVSGGNGGGNNNNDEKKNVPPVMFGAPLPSRVDAYFTRDYNMAKPGRKHVGVQGGFLVLRPSLDTYNEYVDIIREGNFVEGKGWGGKGYGPFYGSMTFQGIVPYYYDELHPGTAVELDRCEYNAMADNPRDKRTVNDVVSGKCRDGRDECEDCRERSAEEVVTAHFTLCQKPWTCLSHEQDQLQHRLCRKLHREWFRVRADLEGRRGRGTFQPDQFFGYCERSGQRGYVPIKVD